MSKNDCFLINLKKLQNDQQLKKQQHVSSLPANALVANAVLWLTATARDRFPAVTSQCCNILAFGDETQSNLLRHNRHGQSYQNNVFPGKPTETMRHMEEDEPKPVNFEKAGD